MIDLIPGIEYASSALNAEKLRMDVVAQNIANVNTTRGLDGQPYRRQEVVFENVLLEKEGELSDSEPITIVVGHVVEDPSPPRRVYNPGHPDAGPDGMVAMPNVDVHREMVDLLAASRAFEANLAVIKTARTMAIQTMSIGDA